MRTLCMTLPFSVTKRSSIVLIHTICEVELLGRQKQARNRVHRQPEATQWRSTTAVSGR